MIKVHTNATSFVPPLFPVIMFRFPGHNMCTKNKELKIKKACSEWWAIHLLTGPMCFFTSTISAIRVGELTLKSLFRRKLKNQISEYCNNLCALNHVTLAFDVDTNRALKIKLERQDKEK